MVDLDSLVLLCIFGTYCTSILTFLPDWLFCFEAIIFNNFLGIDEEQTCAQALHYDIRRGPHSVGSHVRDAAAYVCWAFGRAYYHRDMESVLEQLAPHLLTVACYDREVLFYLY